MVAITNTTATEHSRELLCVKACFCFSPGNTEEQDGW